jgi:hypothetical protein
MIQRHPRLHIDSFPLLSLATALVEAGCGCFANSLELFLRKPGTFGIRYLNSLGVLTTLVLAGFVKGTLELVLVLRGEIGGLLHRLPRLAGRPIPPVRFQVHLFHVYAYAVLAMGIVHLVAQWRVNRKALRYHTYFSGVPIAMPLYARLPWSDLITVKTVYEPLLCFLGSYAIGHLDAVLGTWVWLASLGMFVRARLHYGRARSGRTVLARLLGREPDDEELTEVLGVHHLEDLCPRPS